MTARPWTRIPRLHTAEIELPRELGRLYDLAYNLWWTWNPDARALFSSIDSRSWAHYHNPVQVLLGVERHSWEDHLEDESFLSLYHRIVQSFDRYLGDAEESWFTRTYPDVHGPFAYFCMEFALEQSLPIYSGGLGVLAGDHLKSASDLGLPLVGVGLLYRRGYFSQAIDADGRQQHIYPVIDFNRLPLLPAAGPTGRPVQVAVPLPDREIRAQVWIADVGRVPLLLLDTDIPANDSADRPITSMLYTPGREMRLVQEMVLGIGGARALAELGIAPTVWHMNEGHSALLQFERLGHRLERGEEIEAALATIHRNTVFTTHTPVAAGNEVFDHDLVRRYFEPLCKDSPLEVERWMALGNNDHGEAGQPFNMTAVALRTSARTNGVSKLNAEVAARMWSHLFPESRPEEERIAAITNGVHPQTWLGIEMQDLFGRWFGEKWPQVLSSEIARVAILDNPDEELWEAHQAQKHRLARFLRSRLRDHRARHGLSPDELREIERMFDPSALTIGFARRFALYKRAGLLFSDLHRLRQLVGNAERPVQIVLAGKAHPADKAGQELIQHIFQLTLGDPLRGRVFFVEDYDMRIGRMLVQGVDVWLNTPRRPMEASGTSGMKAGMNGALNCSIADGWWPEGHQGHNGWVIAGKDCGSDEAAQDREDALALYHLLEEEIVPLYYERDEKGIPRPWLARMKEAIATITPHFSSNRMVAEYCQKAYLPLHSAD
ncbi:MAG TPA: alpha-glucan family phosphorylase [Thermoanaerobaculia bacterium]|nr:alpha-glucan family phosphorylase [Thermoanaerobaculia bacterium]